MGLRIAEGTEIKVKCTKDLSTDAREVAARLLFLRVLRRPTGAPRQRCPTCPGSRTVCGNALELGLAPQCFSFTHVLQGWLKHSRVSDTCRRRVAVGCICWSQRCGCLSVKPSRKLRRFESFTRHHQPKQPLTSANTGQRPILLVQLSTAWSCYLQ